LRALGALGPRRRALSRHRLRPAGLRRLEPASSPALDPGGAGGAVAHGVASAGRLLPGALRPLLRCERRTRVRAALSGGAPGTRLGPVLPDAPTGCAAPRSAGDPGARDAPSLHRVA